MHFFPQHLLSFNWGLSGKIFNNFEKEKSLLNTFLDLINTDYVLSVLQFKLMDYLVNKVT